jgi:hypothetical protein
MGIEEVRIFRNKDTLLVDRKLIKAYVLCGIFRREIQRMFHIVAVSRQYRAKARRQVRVHEKLHVSGKWMVLAVSIRRANS